VLCNPDKKAKPRSPPGAFNGFRATWKAGVVPGAEMLQFRDVEGVSAKLAYPMSSDRTGHLLNQTGNIMC